MTMFSVFYNVSVITLSIGNHKVIGFLRSVEGSLNMNIGIISPHTIRLA